MMERAAAELDAKKRVEALATFERCFAAPPTKETTAVAALVQMAAVDLAAGLMREALQRRRLMQAAVEDGEVNEDLTLNARWGSMVGLGMGGPRSRVETSVARALGGAAMHSFV